MPLDTPVVFVVFRRHKQAARVFSRIAEAQPRRLFVIADGPRSDRPDEGKWVQEARAVVEKGVDWECDLLTNYADTNMGLKSRISSGLDWVFEQVEEAIILEDDCVPHPDFFPFCQELLEHYRAEPQVMMIGGFNILGKWKHKQQSYHFSKLPIIWGWATWRRAWAHLDLDLEGWHDPKNQAIVREHLGNEIFFDRMIRNTNAVFSGTVDTWDIPWAYTMMVKKGYSIVPSANLISNVGFTEDATHTKGEHSMADAPAYPLRFPLQHPVSVVQDQAYDKKRAARMWTEPLLPRIVRKTMRLAKKLF